MKKVSVSDIVLTNSHIGYVRYVGPMYNPSENCVTTEIYVGLELVEATGNNDGSINGIRYFETEKGHNYGLLIPQRKIEKVLSGWELLKKFGEQHSIIIDVAKHWNESISRVTQCHERILELEERLDRPCNAYSQDNLCKFEENVSKNSKPEKVKPVKILITSPKKTETNIPTNSLSDERFSHFQPRGKYSVERFSQGLLPNVLSTPTSPSPVSSFRSDLSEISGLSGWEFLEQWRSKNSDDGVRPLLVAENSTPLPPIAESEEGSAISSISSTSDLSRVSSAYFIKGPRYNRQKERRSSFISSCTSEYPDLPSQMSMNSPSEISMNSLTQESMSLYSLDSISDGPPGFSVIYGVVTPTK